LPADFQTLQFPQVEYRGVFINDEDWTTMPFATKNPVFFKNNVPHPKGKIGAEYYEKLFQLLLRLRANTLQPAMHECTVPFFLVEGNRQMAERYGIVLSTSHCEPLLCNAAGEWDIRGQGAYNYISNRENVLAFWEQRLKELGKTENIFTVGMRGKHDGSMEGVKTLQEKTAALQKVIDDQREMLKKYQLSSFPQQFVPYKEVLDIYENGLNLPEDVMLTWCDDNYGYLTRLSSESEQQRSGGAGVYYHLSYWGRPHDYLWLTTTQPGLIYNEMRNAFETGARRMWIANVHDPKIAAYDLELFLDLAWQAPFKPIENDQNAAPEQKNWLKNHLTRWLIREFGTEAGEKLFPAMHEYYRLTSIRKPEFMAFSQVEVDDRKTYPDGKTPAQPSEFSFEKIQNEPSRAPRSEAERYLDDYQKIKNIVSETEKIIPNARKDEFFAAVKYPLFAAAAMAQKWLALDYQSRKAAYEEIIALTDYYNNEMAGGKWKYAMSFNPRNLNVFKMPADTFNNAVKTTSAMPSQLYIARNACDFSACSAPVEPVAMLGHSMNALPLPKGATLTFDFELSQAGEVVLHTALIPEHPNDKGDIRFSVQIDNEAPQVVSFGEKGRTEQWKRNVLRQQAVKTTEHFISEGKHTLKITALDNHIVLDQWMLDFDKERKFYLIPVNSKCQGEKNSKKM